MEKIRTQYSLVVGSCDGLVIWIYQNRTKTGKKVIKSLWEGTALVWGKNNKPKHGKKFGKPKQIGPLRM
jgi:hypothetical protein